ncbi:MAG: glycerophosphodiester phosphodiesterase [Planctomycetota bacterium]
MGLSLGERLAPRAGFVRTGHRGARGLAPENTLPAFQAGASAGVDVLELDVQLSRDRELVVIHDPTVDRTTDGTGAVAELDLAQLQALDAGYRFTLDEGRSFPFRGQGVRISTLAEVLTAFPEHVFTVELKESPYPELAARVAELLRELAPGRALVGAFPHGLLRELRGLDPGLPTSCSQREIRDFYLLHVVGLACALRSPARVLQIPRTSDHERDRGLVLAQPRFLRAAHRSGRSVQVWTINDPDVMRDLIRLGVDGITTDRPDLLNEVLRAEGVRVSGP